MLLLLLLLLWLLRLLALQLVLLGVVLLLASQLSLLLVLLLLLLCWRGLCLLRILRRLVGVAAGAEGPVVKALAHLWRRGFWLQLIFGSLLLRFCLGRIPRRRSLWSRRMARARGAVDRTFASGRRRRWRRKDSAGPRMNLAPESAEELCKRLK